MRKISRLNVITVMVLIASSLTTMAEDAANNMPTTAIDLSFRYRTEIVDQSGFSQNAEASTVRTRATVTTQWSKNIETLFEFDDLTELGLDHFNSAAGTSPNRTQFPVVADPEGTELNQAFIRYSQDDRQVAVGRQRILVANQRYVGGVGWRQNEQTFDSLTFKSKIADALNINYAYVFNVNRIFGESVPAGNNTHSTHLFNADYSFANGKLSAYYFAIDNKDILTFSNNTLGARYTGNYQNLSYTLELATQSDAADNPNDYNASYFLIEGLYNIGDFSIGTAIENLAGDRSAGQGFTTSLATLHGFQGWADVFLTTPAAGIQDITITGKYRINGYRLKAVYHDFSTEQGNDGLGTEIDVVLSKKINPYFSAMLKFASFNSSNIAYASRNKVWLMLTYKL